MQAPRCFSAALHQETHKDGRFTKQTTVHYTCICHVYMHHIQVYMILKTPLLCLICMSTNRFQRNAGENGNIPCIDLLKSSLYLFDNGFQFIVMYFTPHQQEHFRVEKQAFTTLEQKLHKKKKPRADGILFAFAQIVLFSTIPITPL